MSVAAAPSAEGVRPGDGAEPPRRSAIVALAAVHAAWLLAGAVALALPVPARGWAVLAVTLAYVVALPLLARAVGRRDWLAACGVALAISVFQIVPDWILVVQTGTLRFPDLGGPRVGDAIPLVMCGMWTAPLFLTLLLSRGSPLGAALVALLLFAGTELLAPTFGLWEPAGDTTRILGVALYVLPAEAALGAATALAWRAGRDRGTLARLGLGAAVSTAYTGALVVALFLVDRASITISL